MSRLLSYYTFCGGGDEHDAACDGPRLKSLGPTLNQKSFWSLYLFASVLYGTLTGINARRSREYSIQNFREVATLGGLRRSFAGAPTSPGLLPVLP